MGGIYCDTDTAYLVTDNIGRDLKIFTSMEDLNAYRDGLGHRHTTYQIMSLPWYRNVRRDPA